MPTPKQEKLIKLIVENLGSKGETKSFGELMLEAGYSKAQSLNPAQILESETIKDGVGDFVKEMKKKREKALAYITEDKLAESSARDNAAIVDILTKNVQLLSGEDTERIGLPTVIKIVKPNGDNIQAITEAV